MTTTTMPVTNCDAGDSSRILASVSPESPALYKLITTVALGGFRGLVSNYRGRGGTVVLTAGNTYSGVWVYGGTLPANGTWKVYDKQVDPPSENYGSGAMPYATMFYPDMYVHYSPGFHSVGYRQSSHGCVNIGKLAEAVWIFRHTPIGSKVYIFSPKVA